MKILALFLFWKLYKSVWSGYSVVRCPIESKMVFTDSCTVRLVQTIAVTLRRGSGVAGASVCKTYIREWMGMLSTHVVILRTSARNTVCNDGYMCRQRLAVMCDRHTCVVTAGRNDWTRVYAVYDP